MSVRRRPRLPVASDDTPSLLDQWNQCGAIDGLVEQPVDWIRDAIDQTCGKPSVSMSSVAPPVITMKEASDPFSRAVLSNLRALMPGILKSVSRQMIRLAT